MNYTQLVRPNPNVSCEPTWCYKYVGDAFGGKFPVVYTTAIMGWEKAKFQHLQLPPLEVYVPIFFSLSNDVRGHAALFMSDGSVYSCSSSTLDTPIHYDSIKAMIADYARVGNTLTYLGWTEDFSGLRIVKEEGGMFMVDKNLIGLYYKALLGREVDAAGLKNVGLPADVVFTRLMQSTEYAKRQAIIAKALAGGTILKAGLYKVK